MSMQTLQELVDDVNAWAKQHGQEPHIVIPTGKTVEMIFMESLPRTSEKDKRDRPIPDDIHARLVAAMHGERLVGAKPLSEVCDLDETPRDAKVVRPEDIPAGTHEKLAESLDGGHVALPDDVHRRLARAL
jgi:hypothetical protein